MNRADVYLIIRLAPKEKRIIKFFELRSAFKRASYAEGPWVVVRNKQILRSEDAILNAASHTKFNQQAWSALTIYPNRNTLQSSRIFKSNATLFRLGTWPSQLLLRPFLFGSRPLRVAILSFRRCPSFSPKAMTDTSPSPFSVHFNGPIGTSPTGADHVSKLCSSASSCMGIPCSYVSSPPKR